MKCRFRNKYSPCKSDFTQIPSSWQNCQVSKPKLDIFVQNRLFSQKIGPFTLYHNMSWIFFERPSIDKNWSWAVVTWSSKFWAWEKIELIIERKFLNFYSRMIFGLRYPLIPKIFFVLKIKIKNTTILEFEFPPF